MKFTDGQWTLKPHMSHLMPQRVYTYDVEDHKVTLYTPVKPVLERANTLDQGMLTMEFTSPLANVLNVRIYHHLGKASKQTGFDVEMEQLPLKTMICEQKMMIQSGELTAEISLQDSFSITYYYQGKKITATKSKGTAYILNEETKEVFIKEQLALGVGECVYGLGERFTPFVKNGQVVDIWNEDGGTSSEISYKNIPFYLTNANYGIFVNHTGKVSFEVASEQVESVQFSVPGESMEYSIIAGSDMKHVLENYTTLTGRSPVPPAWSYGLWLSTSFTTDYDEQTVVSFIDKMQAYEIPMRVFHFDCFWMKAFQWCDFEWDKDTFPDPEGMLARLKERGLKICVWINPYVAQKSKLFKEGMDKGYFITNTDGTVWQWDKWQAGMAIVDFTNPAACEWYRSKLKRLLDMGVDCFKTDFGERIPEDVRYHDSSDPQLMHNYYTYLYNKLVFELMAEETGESVLFARSATVGCQKFPVHWGGDCWGTYESMAESLRGGLSLCLSGFGYWSHDIGGFETSSTADLYKRWVAFGLFSTHSRLHGSHSYRVPWNYDEESCEVLNYFARLKNKLMPYLYEQSQLNAKTGIPVMRPLILDHPDDKVCNYIDLQYMLGDRLLVAPVFNEDGIADYYLPAGTWVDLITNQKYEGGRYIKESVDYFHIPVLVKENSIIPMGTVEEKPDYDYSDGVTFFVYNLAEDHESSCCIYDLDGNQTATFIASKSGSVYTITIRGVVTAAKIVFVHELQDMTCDELAIISTENGTIVDLHDVSDRVFTLHIKEA